MALSVFLITCNEEVRIARTLEAVRDLADQIVVVDSGSTDDTVAIARALGAEVHFREWTGYGPQKRYAEQLCKHDWVLNLDADEVATPELAREIRSILDRNPSPAGYKLKINEVYPGDAKPRPFANDYNVVRLYHRSVGSYRDDPLFDRVEMTPGSPTRQLSNPVWHYPCVSFHQLIAKLNKYTDYYATATKRRSKAALALRLPFEMPVFFLKAYLLRLHVTGGWKGFVIATIHSFARFIRLAKMLAAQEALESSQKPASDVG